MADQLIDRYTAVGIGGVREKTYDKGTAPQMGTGTTVTNQGTRDIAFGLKPNLDSLPIPIIETIDDMDVIGRPWDAPSEIRQVSNMVQVDLTWPRLTLKEAMTMIVLALSKHDESTSSSNTKISAYPKNETDSTSLYSTSLTVNIDQGDGPSTQSGTSRFAATIAEKTATFDPGQIRAYDGFFVNSFELSLERGTERLFQLTVSGYASGSYGASAVKEAASGKFYQNNYMGTELSSIAMIDSFLNSYVDSRTVAPSGDYLRGTKTKAWLAFTATANETVGNLSASTARRLTSRAFADRSTETGTENLSPTGSNRAAGPALLDLNNLAYNFRLSYNNNVDIEDLLRWGGGDRITAAERQAATIELSLELDLQDYSYYSKLIENYNMAFQLICAPSTNEGMGIFMPIIRQSAIAQSRRGIKRTQQLTLMPLGKEAATAPMYIDFKLPTAQLPSSGKLFATDASTSTSTGRK